jgi:GNAT superfamily N-acetyltransferase
MTTTSVRAALPDDAVAITALHSRAWQWAYQGQIPDDYLDGLTAELSERTARRREYLTFPRTAHRTWVAERDGRAIGFAHTGPSRDPDPPTDTAEVYAIYLDPDVVGTGVGRALFGRAIDDLRLRGYQAATLWVLASNARARRFYEAAGWQLDGATKTEDLRGFPLVEVQYRIALQSSSREPCRSPGSGLA